MNAPQLLNQILAERALRPLFQPIVQIAEGRLLGHEALIRGPQGSPLESPAALFGTALACGRLAELDLLCRQIQIQHFVGLDLPGRLFLNVTPMALEDPQAVQGETLRMAKEAGIGADTVAIELTELTPVDDYDNLRHALEHYRGMGFSVALDDLGAGYAGLRHWVELRPDYVKVDRAFVTHLDRDPVRRQFIQAICDLARGTRCAVIVEGIETEAELAAVRELGVAYGQGYLLGAPAARPPPTPQAAAALRPAPRAKPGGRLGDTAQVLLREQAGITPEVTVQEVVERFQREARLRTLPVLAQGRPVGVVRREHIIELFSRPYIRELHSRKPIAQFMHKTPLTVAADLPLEALSRELTGREEGKLDEDFLIVSAGGDYLGLGTPMDLLKRITELQVRHAAYANPLTGLPGNVPINEHIDGLIAEGHGFLVAYCDLDNFKPFNDAYGYARGDAVITYLGRLLAGHVNPALDFVGHVGGDDFVLTLRSPDWQGCCRRILDEFGAHAPQFYDPEDRARGGLSASDRQGRDMFFPFLSLSIGVVPVCPGRFASHHEVAAAASGVKHQAKKMDGNALFVDRRHGDNGDCERLLGQKVA